MNFTVVGADRIPKRDKALASGHLVFVHFVWTKGVDQGLTPVSEPPLLAINWVIDDVVC